MATHVSDADLLRFRLVAHGLIGRGAKTVVDVSEHMLAIQAQDFQQAGWALAVRTASARADDVADAFSSRSLVRSWPMRGTLHIVPAPDLNWMLQLTTQRMLARTATRRRQLELDDTTLEKARDASIAALSGGRALSRAGLMTVFEDSGIATGGQRGYHLIYHLAQTGTLVWGPPEVNQQALVLSDEWIAEPRRLESDEALGSFLRRYLDGHGPATLKDFVWWTNLTVAQAKTARSVAGAAVAEIENGGASYLLPHDLPDHAPALRSAHVRALPGFDEYVLGYQDRTPVIDPAFAQRVVPGGNGMFLPTIISRGRVVGTWRRTERGNRSHIGAEPFTTMTQREESGFGASAKRFAHYLTLTA